ncbi:MAG: GNAT family N-acetyltransferase [Anaerolineales bacterium]|nr:GNAT family N-acetyltransferase [Anaerolineales bacterium]
MKTVTNKPILIKPSDRYRHAFLAMAAEYQQAGESYRHHELGQSSFAAFLELVDNDDQGIGLPAGYAPMTHFWLVKDEAILGESRLRHCLTPALEIEGGHIGYSIRPSQRHKGYGTLILALTLEQARGRGLRRIRVTCDTDNLASARVIEKNSGHLSGRTISNRSGQQIYQYWIDLL